MTILSPWIQLGRTLGFGWQQHARMLNAPVSHWDGWDLQLVLLCQASVQGSLCAHAGAAGSRAIPAPRGQGRCRPSGSSAAAGTVNAHPFLYGQRTREGLTREQVQKNQHGNVPVTVQLHTRASYLWHFLSITGEKILSSKELGSCGD